ncbi:MAG: HEPN domain-containing protein [bacterium]|nr:HEPN domain-containing protein [bacterium]
MTPEIKALIIYRLEQADESLESAQLLFDNNKFRPAINRLYYAMFYAILVLPAQSKQQTSKIKTFRGDFIVRSGFCKTR